MSWAKNFQRENAVAANEIIDTSRLTAAFSDDEIIINETKPEAEPPPEPKKQLTAPPAPAPTSKLVDELDRIEGAWLEQLTNIKLNAGTIENKMKACIVALRQDIARLDLLADQARKEAERGVKVARHFANSLDQIKGSR